MKYPEKIYLYKTSELIPSNIHVTGSKSESNRALILNALAGNIVSIDNLSKARDTRIMGTLLNSGEDILDVRDAGTTMRFLAAYLSLKGENKILTGTERMKERPVGLLVNALRSIGADISYVENEGFPPIRISRIKQQKRSSIVIPGNVSSQYISALLMIAPCLPEGLEIELTGEIGSKPYIQMTLELLYRFGITYSWEGSLIKIEHQEFKPQQVSIEPDWSGASYWYSFAALSQTSEIRIPGLRKISMQGDSIIAKLCEDLGVATRHEDDGITLEKIKHRDFIEVDFKACPDLAQTIAVICAAKGIHASFTGLESLRIKETDRIKALQHELAKINSELIDAGGHRFDLIPSNSLPSKAFIETYDDHRMAMAFAPLCTTMDLEINNPSVVEKSYPEFWQEVQKVGVQITPQPDL